MIRDWCHDDPKMSKRHRIIAFMTIAMLLLTACSFGGQDIVNDDVQTTTEAGDSVLYSGDKIVVFYGSNTWAYTRLGHVDLSKEEMTELLGGGDVVVTLLED